MVEKIHLRKGAEPFRDAMWISSLYVLVGGGG